jgi:hypothetical protein
MVPMPLDGSFYKRGNSETSDGGSTGFGILFVAFGLLLLLHGFLGFFLLVLFGVL